jgi:hypothetical protein
VRRLDFAADRVLGDAIIAAIPSAPLLAPR